jgi:hypothetical protein
MSNGIETLRLSVTIAYRPGACPLGYLRQALLDHAWRGFSNGAFTDSTDAEIVGWKSEVESVECPELWK